MLRYLLIISLCVYWVSCMTKVAPEKNTAMTTEPIQVNSYDDLARQLQSAFLVYQSSMTKSDQNIAPGSFADENDALFNLASNTLTLNGVKLANALRANAQNVDLNLIEAYRSFLEQGQLSELVHSSPLFTLMPVLYYAAKNQKSAKIKTPNGFKAALQTQWLERYNRVHFLEKRIHDMTDQLSDPGQRADLVAAISLRIKQANSELLILKSVLKEVVSESNLLGKKSEGEKELATLMIVAGYQIGQNLAQKNPDLDPNVDAEIEAALHARNELMSRLEGLAQQYKNLSATKTSV